jgi:hypothetical protein
MVWSVYLYFTRRLQLALDRAISDYEKEKDKDRNEYKLYTVEIT